MDKRKKVLLEFSKKEDGTYTSIPKCVLLNSPPPEYSVEIEEKQVEEIPKQEIIEYQEKAEKQEEIKARDKGVKETTFKSLKRRATAVRVLKSLMIAVTVANLFVAAYFLCVFKIPFKPEIVELFRTVIPSALGQLLGVIVGFSTYFILRKNDKKLAREFDSEFGLKERLQTSLEYKDLNTPMAVLLREDVKDKTSKLDKKQIKIKRLPLYIISVVVSSLLAMVLVAFLPFNIIQPQPEEKTPFELTEMQKKQIESIIARVESSNMKEPAKTEVASEVRALLNVLSTTKIKDDADALISLSVKKIDTITKSTGTSYQLYELLLESENAYTRDMGRLLTLLDWSKFKIKREKIRAYFEHKEYGTEDADIKKITEETVILVRTAGSELRSALLKSGIDEGDKLYGELLATAVGMERLAGELESGYINYRATVGTTEQGEIFFLIEDDIYRALDEQNISYSVGFGASDEIRKMFGFSIPNREDNRSEKKEEDDQDQSDEEEEKPTDGGGTSGSDIYGSDDQIYDKNEGYIKYGEVLNTYYQIMGSTEYTDEQKVEIQKYFETLFRGLEEKKG
jgi:hypothetical protein